MKADNITEESIERMIQTHIRHVAESRLHSELGSRYRHISRIVALRHYAATCCVVTAVCCLLTVAAPEARASATSRCTLVQRQAALDTSEQIIRDL